jgi:hypothetical protein
LSQAARVSGDWPVRDGSMEKVKAKRLRRQT